MVPAFREEGRIGATIASLRSALDEHVGGAEIVVVDDGSGDATAQRATAAGADRVVQLPRNKGKGGAVRAGMLAASGSAVVFTDADLSYPPSQVLRVLARIEQGSDVVVGSRQHAETQTIVGSSWLRDVAGRLFNLTTGLVLTRHFSDTQCGLKGFHRSAAQRIFAAARVDGFAFDVELLWLAGHFGFVVEEVPVELASAEGSTVRLKVDPLKMIRDLWRIRRWVASGAYGPSAASE